MTEPFVNIIRLKVVDGRGRTLCYLQKQTHYDENGTVTESESWSAPSKPIKGAPEGVASRPARRPRPPVSRQGDHVDLELPGLVVNLNKLSPMLDRFAAVFGLVDESGAAIVSNDRDTDPPRLTVDQLRSLYF